MRILLVSHLFPPTDNAGTELYTLRLAQELVRAGQEVAVVTTRKEVERPDLALSETEHEGIPVFELRNNLFYEDFRETWEHPGIERVFEQVLEAFAPDVVHFQHLMYLSVGCLRLARQRARTVLMTLHDFWLQCPRFGQLVHPEGTLCHAVDYGRCGTCLPSFKWGQSALERKTGRAIASVRSAVGVNFGPLARGAARLVKSRRRPTEVWSPPDDELRAQYAELARTRAESVRAAVLEHVDRFVSPSAFLREHFVQWGIPEERILHMPTGLDADLFSPASRRPRTDVLQVAFIGTLVPLKGAHVLLQAWSLLSEAERKRGKLRIFGPGEHTPEYFHELSQTAARLGVELPGPLARAEVARELARTDLLVVPSTWFENRPLILLEALGARTPVVASNLGGMAELVDDGVNGWKFTAGNAAALAQRLRGLLLDPSALDDLFQSAPEVPAWADLTRATVRLYQELAGVAS